MSLVDSGVKRQRLDASTWLLSGEQTGAYEGGEEADGEDGEDIEDEVDDEDMWEDAGGADGVAPAPDAAHTLMMPTGNLTLMLDAEDRPGGPVGAPAAAADPGLKTILSAEEERRQRLLLKAAKQAERQEGQRRREAFEVVHRVALQCWLAHGVQLSQQASEPLLHSLLLSLLPPDLALASAPRRLDLAGLRRILAWLPSCFDAATHGGDGAAGPVRLIERRWLLLSLLHLGREPGAPDWAAAAVGAVEAELSRAPRVAAGAAAAFVPPPGRGSALRERLAELAHEAHAAALLRPAEAGGGGTAGGSGGGEGREAEGEAEELAPQQRVRVVGISSKPELNGREATVVRFDSKLGRWRVRTDAGANLALLRGNLERVGGSSSGGGGSSSSGGGSSSSSGGGGSSSSSGGGGSSSTRTGGGGGGGESDVARGSLQEALATRRATATQQLLVLVGFLRSRGLTARLVVALQPPPRKPPPKPKPKAAGGGGKAASGAVRTAKPPHQVPCWAEVYLPREGRWVALDPFFKPSTPAVDTPEAILSARVSGRALAARAYIVGFGEDESAVDVTVRYVPDYAACRAVRTSHEWWEAALALSRRGGAGAEARAGGGEEGRAEEREALARGATSRDPVDLTADLPPDAAAPAAGHAGPSTSAAAAAAAAEAAEVRSRLRSQPMPSSLAAFKKDAHYVLERDLGRYEVLHPSDTPFVGLFKGERVYPRASVVRLMTEERWFRQARCLLPAQAPLKRVPKGGGGGGGGGRGGGGGGGGGRGGGGRGRGGGPPWGAARGGKAPIAGGGRRSADGGGRGGGGGDGGEECDGEGEPAEGEGGCRAEGGGGEGALDLYAEWQTYAYEPPAAIGGVVPRSERGHVEMWSEKHLPLGTKWLRAPHVAAAAKKLGVDCAPAMVGFDFRDGRSVPRFDGVIVCEEAAPLLVEAAAGIAEAEEDKLSRKLRRRALGQWATLLNALRLRARLEAQYGRGDD